MYTLNDLQIELFNKLSEIFPQSNVFYFYPNKNTACIYPRVNFVFEGLQSHTFGNDNPEQKMVQISIGYSDKNVNFEAMDKIVNLMNDGLENAFTYSYEQGPQLFDDTYNIYTIIYTFQGILGSKGVV